MVKDFYKRFGQAEVIRDLWIGEIYSSIDYDYLVENNIKLVINMTTSRVPIALRKRDIEYIRFGLEDESFTDDKIRIAYHQRFMAAAKIIDERRRMFPDDGILIHCIAGINRSATALAYYLVLYRNWSYDDAVSILTAINKKERKIPCLTNKDFRSLIKEVAGRYQD